MNVHHLYRRTDPETSREAAEEVVLKNAAQRETIHGYLWKHGPRTSSEVDMGFGWAKNTAGRRISELVAQGHVYYTGAKRLGQFPGDKKQRVMAALAPLW